MIDIVLPVQKGAPFTEAFREPAEFLYEILRRERVEVCLRSAETSFQFQDSKRYIVFGPHLFSSISPSPNIVLVNLEQLANSPLATKEYIGLLAHSLTIDYCEANIPYYSGQHSNARQLGLLVLCGELFSNRINITAQKKEYHLFFGALTKRRRSILSSLEDRGIPVLVKTGIYGSELQLWIQKAKSILNIHAYAIETPLESIRLMPLIGSEVPVLTEKSIIDSSNQWLLDKGLGFVDFSSVKAPELESEHLNHAQEIAPLLKAHLETKQPEDYLQPLLMWCHAASGSTTGTCLARPWSYQLSGLHVGCGNVFIPTMLNIDIKKTPALDIEADICAKSLLPLKCNHERFPGGLFVGSESINSIYMKCTFEHLDDPIAAMTNARDLLMPGGLLYLEVPYDLAFGAWQDPTHRRAVNQNSFRYYYEWAWYLGWDEWGLKTQSIRPILSDTGRELKAKGTSIDELTAIPRAIDSLEVLMIKKLLPEQVRLKSASRHNPDLNENRLTIQDYKKEVKYKPEHVIETLFQDSLYPETEIPKWHQDLKRLDPSKWDESNLPSVSICTPTTSRRHLFLLNCLLQILCQDYPLSKIEWIIVGDDDDDGLSSLQALTETILDTQVVRLPPGTPIGRKRNLSYSLSRNNLIFNFDDDDFYFPERILDAVRLFVQQATISDCYVGSNLLPIFFSDLDELWLSQPRIGVACAGSFAFPRSLSFTSHHDECVSHGEEISFTRNYTLRLIDQDPTSCMVCFAHSSNTFDKKRLRRNGEREWIKNVGSINDKSISYLFDSQLFKNLQLIEAKSSSLSALHSQIEDQKTLRLINSALTSKYLARLIGRLS